MKKVFIPALVMFSLVAPIATFAQISDPSTPPTSTHATPNGIDVPCISAALDTRDAAIAAAFNALNASTQTALTTRTPELKAAYALPTRAARIAARQAAWTKYNSALKVAQTTFKTQKDAAWRAYEAASPACHVPAGTEGNAASHVNG